MGQAINSTPKVLKFVKTCDKPNVNKLSKDIADLNDQLSFSVERFLEHVYKFQNVMSILVPAVEEAVLAAEARLGSSCSEGLDKLEKAKRLQCGLRRELKML